MTRDEFIDQLLSYFPVPVNWTDMDDGSLIVSPQGEEVCDFCSGPNPVWEYPCRDFSWGEHTGSLGSWGACEPCAELIEAGDLDGTAARCAAHNDGLDSWRRDRIRGLHQQFWDNRYGERKPI